MCARARSGSERVHIDSSARSWYVSGRGYFDISKHDKNKNVCVEYQFHMHACKQVCRLNDFCVRFVLRDGHDDYNALQHVPARGQRAATRCTVILLRARVEGVKRKTSSQVLCI
jgi:hypothetical protein